MLAQVFRERHDPAAGLFVFASRALGLLRGEFSICFRPETYPL